jgi:RHS repeat-associated protein
MIRKAFAHCLAPALLLLFASAAGHSQPALQSPPAGAIPPWAFNDRITPLTAALGVTALSGRVVTTEGVALPRVTINNGPASTTTDEQGLFLLTGVTAGTSVMIIDARQAGAEGKTDYGYYELQVTAAEGQTNVLPFKSFLPKIDHAHDVTIESPTTSETVISNPELPGLEFHIPAGAIITGPDHKPVTKVSITPIPLDRTPFPLPKNVEVPIYFTVQPGGATITGVDGKWLGAQVWYPNVEHQLPGARGSFWRYDPYHLGWTIYGTGSVSADGQHVVPDADTRVYDFTSAMFNTGFTPPNSGPPAPPCESESPCPPPCESGGGGGSSDECPASCGGGDGGGGSGAADSNSCTGGDPVDLASGYWVEARTDLSLRDLIPLTMVRTYRQGDTNVRDFGVGKTLNLDMYLWSANQYQEVDLITPAGGRIHYIRVSPGTGFADAVFTTTAAPGPYFNSSIFWNGTSWTLLRQDGMTYVFGENAPVQYMQDRYGNRVSFIRSAGPNTPITTISSPSGRSIKLTYTSGVITQATDNASRTYTYSYDSNKRLQSVTDPNGGVTTYVWDTTNNRITSVRRPRQQPSGPVFVTNTYDANGRVHQQTLVDGAMWLFNYALDGSGKVIETDATDPNGNIRKVTFNSAGYWLTDKRAFGTAIEQDYTAIRGGTTPPAGCSNNTSANSPTNYLIALTDALGRLSCWTYDPAGKILTIGRLAGTANAVTSSYAYGAFEQLTQITDPLGHTISVGSDSLGRLTSITDALSHTWSFTPNADGTIASMTDPLSQTTSFTYDHGDVSSVTDPLSRLTTRFTDGSGRTIRRADASGNVWQWRYDSVWGVHLAIDANGNTITINYNTDGLITSIVDPRSTFGTPIQTQYTYDSKDRLTGRTDPLSHTDVINTYDGNDSVLSGTDRNGHNTSYTYDALNRLVTATYADGHVVSYTWDAGNRITQIQDTIGGISNTITRTYDGLDRLTQEQVVQGTTTLGTVAYTYDGASRRATTTVSGQGPITYAFDNADRLLQVSQGAATVSFGYDNADRRTSLSLPNGIVATYAYDAASQLTGISYDNSGVNLGTLSYAYDGAGRMTNRGGTLFQSTLPTPVATAMYDLGNRLTQWDSTSLAYDSNGNLTNDGANSYTWDARNRLTGLTGVAGFAYDGTNRRQSITTGATTVTTVYDVYDPIQEQSGGSVLSNLLIGLGIDERFTRTEGSTTSTFLTDLLRSTVALTDDAANLQTSYRYDPYGVVSSTGAPSDNAYQFTGRQNDGTGLYYFRSRYYNPSWGRFISEDQIRLRGGINLYAYAQSSPSNNVDPDGSLASPVTTMPAASSRCDVVQIGKKSIPYRCVNCTAPTGGVYYPYCPDCFKKSIDPEGGVPRIPPIIDPKKYWGPGGGGAGGGGTPPSILPKLF